MKNSLNQLNKNSYSKLLEKYYEFLYQEDNALWLTDNLIYSRDVEYASGEFLERLYSEVFGKFIDYKNIATDPAFFIKQIRDVYKTKGSEESFRILFRALYGTEIEITYPWENVLIPSSGGWDVRNIIIIELTNQLFSIEKIRLNTLKIINPVSGEITYANIENIVSREAEKIYELYLCRGSSCQKNSNSDLPKDGLIFFNDTQIGVLQEIVSEIKIENGGSGFSIGQNISYIFSNGSSLEFIIESVGEAGSIEKIKIMKFPIYETGIDGLFFTSDGTVLTTSFDINEVHITFATDQSASYDGRYLDNKGFLSDTIYLHDGFFYQKYSYTIQSTIPRDLYIDTVDNIVHPAGTILFSIFDLKSELTIDSGKFNEINKHIHKINRNSIRFDDSDFYRVITAPDISDSPSFSEIFDFETTRVIEPESFGVWEELQITTTRYFYESITIGDKGIQKIDVIPVYTDDVAVNESYEFLFNKSLPEDYIKVTDELCVYKLYESTDLYSEDDDYFAEQYSYEERDLKLIHCT